MNKTHQQDFLGNKKSLHSLMRTGLTSCLGQGKERARSLRYLHPLQQRSGLLLLHGWGAGDQELYSCYTSRDLDDNSVCNSSTPEVPCSPHPESQLYPSFRLLQGLNLPSTSSQGILGKAEWREGQSLHLQALLR